MSIMLEPQTEHAFFLVHLSLVRRFRALPRGLLVALAMVTLMLGLAVVAWAVETHVFVRSPERACVSATTRERAHRLLHHENKTGFVISSFIEGLFGMERIDYSPVRGLLLLPRSQWRELNVTVLKNDEPVTNEACLGESSRWSLQWELFGYGAVYNSLVREVGNGFATDPSSGEVMVLVTVDDDMSLADWITFKLVLLTLCVTVQRGVALVARFALAASHVPSQQQLAQARSPLVRYSVAVAPLIMGTAVLYGVAAVVKELMEDFWLAILFVALHWAAALLQLVTLRTASSGIVFSRAVDHAGTIVLLYCMQLYSLGIRYEVMLAAALVIFCCWIALFVFVEIPALASGQINEERVRDGLFIRRLNVQLIHQPPPPPPAAADVPQPHQE